MIGGRAPDRVSRADQRPDRQGRGLLDQAIDQARLPDPGFSLHQDRPALSLLQPDQPLGEQVPRAPTDQGPAGRPREALAARAEDGDRLRPAFQPAWWQRLEGQLRLGRLPGRRVADELVVGPLA